jgi:hypothetical protein
MATTLEMLSDATQTIEGLIETLTTTSSPEYELQKLDLLAAKLGDAAVAIQKATGSFKPSREGLAWRASESLMKRAQSDVRTVLAEGKLKNVSAFKRNIILIFDGPKQSALDSQEMTSRKAQTKRRCERIRKLSADGILAWALSYTATEWGAGAMRNDVFDCLLEEIDPRNVEKWPASVCELLQKIREANFRDSSDFDLFVNGENH